MATFLYPPVSVTTLPPMGGATSANQLTEIAELQSINQKLNFLDKKVSEFLYFPYVGVSSAGYTELIASTLNDIKSMTWFESGGFPTVIALGAPGSEVDKFLIPPGGLNGEVPIDIPAGSRISIKELVSDAISATSFISANFYK